MNGAALLRRTAAVVVAAGLVVLSVVAVRKPAPERPDAARSATTTTKPVTPLGLPAPRTEGAAPAHTKAGTYLTVSPDSTGALEVLEQIRLTAPTSHLILAVPLQSGAVALKDIAPAVEDLQAQAGGDPVTVRSTITSGQVTVTLPTATETIDLRYRLVTSASRSNPAPIGRALAFVAPLSRMSKGSASVTVNVVGSTIRNLTCPDLPQPQQVCGRQNGQTWTAGPLPALQSDVFAQLDLPGPGAT